MFIFELQSILAFECVGVPLGVPYRTAFANVQRATKIFVLELTSNPSDVSFVPRDLRQCSPP